MAKIDIDKLISDFLPYEHKIDKGRILKSLGWVFEEYWNNRAIYGLGKDSDCPYALFEHQGEVGIVYNGKCNYYNLREDDIKEFTKTLNTREMIMHNPDKYKVSDLFDACKAIDDILTDFAIRKLKEDNEENFQTTRKKITMATITEDYVSFETAKLLKEKGFDEKCFHYYEDNRHRGEDIKFSDWRNIEYSNSEIGRRFTCPTLQMAMKWLREVHGLFISIGCDDLNWNWQVFDIKHRDENLDPICKSESYGGLDSYKEACERAIKYCLEDLI